MPNNSGAHVRLATNEDWRYILLLDGRRGVRQQGGEWMCPRSGYSLAICVNTMLKVKRKAKPRREAVEGGGFSRC